VIYIAVNTTWPRTGPSSTPPRSRAWMSGGGLAIVMSSTTIVVMVYVEMRDRDWPTQVSRGAGCYAGNEPVPVPQHHKRRNCCYRHGQQCHRPENARSRHLSPNAMTVIKLPIPPDVCVCSAAGSSKYCSPHRRSLSYTPSCPFSFRCRGLCGSAPRSRHSPTARRSGEPNRTPPPVRPYMSRVAGVPRAAWSST
jgi:hypothetical protein